MKAIHIVNITLGILVTGLLLLNLLPEDSDYQPLTRLVDEEISSIRIVTDRHSLHFTKQDNWQLNAASNKPLKQDTISKLLGIARTHSYRQFENSAANIKALGFEQATSKIILNDTEILFGTTEPVQQLRYVMVNEQIHLITDLYLQFLLADESFFVAATN